MMATIKLTGNTYPIRDALKGRGFRFDGSSKAWTIDAVATANQFGMTGWSSNGCFRFSDEQLAAWQASGVVVEMCEHTAVEC